MRDCFAPCAVANYYGLPDAPFTTVSKARAALIANVSAATGMPPIELRKASDYDLACMLQHDLLHAPLPMPPESTVGLAHRLAYGRMIAGADGDNMTDPALLAAVSATPCCRVEKSWNVNTGVGFQHNQQ